MDVIHYSAAEDDAHTIYIAHLSHKVAIIM